MKGPITASIGDFLSKDARAELDHELKDLISDRVSRDSFISSVGEAISIERGLYVPAETENQRRRDRLEKLRRTAKAFEKAVTALDWNTWFLLRQEATIVRGRTVNDAWLSDLSPHPPHSLENVFEELTLGARTLARLSDRMLTRKQPRAVDGKTRRQRKPQVDTVSDALAIMIIRAFCMTTGATAAYSRNSRLYQIFEALARVFRWRTIGEKRLRKLGLATDPHT